MVVVGGLGAVPGCGWCYKCGCCEQQWGKAGVSRRAEAMICRINVVGNECGMSPGRCSERDVFVYEDVLKTREKR